MKAEANICDRCDEAKQCVTCKTCTLDLCKECYVHADHLEDAECREFVPRNPFPSGDEQELARTSEGIAKRPIRIPPKEYKLETEKWKILLSESQMGDGSTLMIQSKRGEFLIVDLGTGQVSYPSLQLTVALRSR